MLVSLNFVERFISLPKIEEEIIVNNKKINRKIYDLSKICPILTRQGFEVDSTKMIGEGLDLLVVGRIESAKPHPNASKLQICSVNVGELELRQIVCGASNARKNLYVAVALPGLKLPNNLEIKPTTIREVESFGMLCSREELGLPIIKEIDGDGIWEIENSEQGGKNKAELERFIGVPLFQALDMHDVIVEISVTPNRPDILCHEGVARELAAGFAYARIPFEKKNPYFFSSDLISDQKIKADVIENSSLKIDEFNFTVENFLNAPTFFMAIQSIKVSCSPAWLRNLMEALGQNSINTVVDASNYILLAYGQPNHAFDIEKINVEHSNQKKITLRHARANENFYGLDGKLRQLHESDCVVSDSKEVQALLGVLGGQNSKVSNETKTIVVEFANPSPVSIRRTSRRHGRQTDASFMFEKGIDASARFKASSEFFALLSKLSNTEIKYLGAIHSKNLESHPIIKTEFSNLIIPYSSKDQINVLGADIISFVEQKNILTSLGFKVDALSDDLVHITVPQWRSNDIMSFADLVEECIRVVGIDHIPSQPLVTPNIVRQDDPHFSFIEKLNSHAISLGYQEIISLHFMRSDDFEKLNLASINSLGEPIAVINPIIGDEPLLQTTLVPDLLRKVAKNLNYGVKNGQMFHSCRTFQNYNVLGNRVFGENGCSLKLNEMLSTPISHNLCEYSNKFGYFYSKEAEKGLRPVETPRFAGVAFGVRQEKSWQNSGSTNWLLHDLIAHVVELGRIVGIQLDYEKISENLEDSNYHPVASSLHPGRRVNFFVDLEEAKLPIGWCGELHPKVTRNFEIDTNCFAFELNVANLMVAGNKLNIFVKNNVSTQKFPTVTRDFAFLFEEQVTAKQIQDCVKNSLSVVLGTALPVTLNSIQIFDIYRGKGIEPGKKSVAFKIVLDPTERTLTEKDIQLITDKVIAAVNNEFKCQLRA